MCILYKQKYDKIGDRLDIGTIKCEVNIKNLKMVLLFDRLKKVNF